MLTLGWDNQGFSYYLIILNLGPGANDLWKINFCNSAQLEKKELEQGH